MAVDGRDMLRRNDAKGAIFVDPVHSSRRSRSKLLSRRRAKDCQQHRQAASCCGTLERDARTNERERPLLSVRPQVRS
jgi:hypothetical protein